MKHFYIALLMVFLLGGCGEKPVVKVTSIAFIDNLDKGSGNFDRMVKICFDQPLKGDYFHKLTVVSQQGFKLSGGAPLKPLASKPDTLCHHRNLYNYINRDSPPNARQMIKDYLVPGNINQVLVQVYFNRPEAKEVPISEVLLRGL